MNNTRRGFIRIVPMAGAALLLGRHAQAADMVSESDPTAKGLGYVADATKVDKAKFANYVAGSVCGGCQLFQGKAGDASGPCGIFGGKLVAAKGWCSAFAKKA